MRKKFLGFITFGLSSLFAFTQGTYVPLNSDVYHLIDRYEIEYGKVLPSIATNFKPYNRVDVAAFAEGFKKENLLPESKKFKFNLNYLMNENSEWIKDTIIQSKKKIWYFYPEPASLFLINKENLLLKINPVLQFQIGKDSDENKLLQINTRGVEIRGNIAQRIGYYTYLTTTLSRFPKFVQNRINSEDAVPGEGFWKDYKNNGQDYFTARGYITFNAIKYVNFQFGHDKNFIGNGYRSLLLSDYANNSFFLKVQTKIWRLTYTNLFKELTVQFERGSDRLLDKKYAAIHHLNVHVVHWLDIGLFEAIVFQRRNHFELQYLNPIIFYRAIEQSLGSPDNALVGIDYKINAIRHLSIYGQFMLDEYNFKQIIQRNGWWANKFAFQSGMKYINAFGISHFDLQGEFNMVRPFTYTHSSVVNNFTHYNQPLAHPLGANFFELIGIVQYQITPSLLLTARLIYAQKGLDNDTSNFGGNIFIPTTNPINNRLNVSQEFGNTITQGIAQNLLIFNTILSYQVRHNLFVDFNPMYRKVSSPDNTIESSSMIFNFGIRWNLPYRTYEF